MKKTLILTMVLECVPLVPGRATEVKQALGSESQANATMKNALGAGSGIGAKDSPVNGFNAGVQIGFVATDSKVKIGAGTLPGMPNINSKSDVSGEGIAGGVHFGWGYLTDEYIYLGLEANANLADADGSTSFFILNTPKLTTKVEVTQLYDLSARFGYLYQNAALPYLKAGIALGHWKANSKTNVNLSGSSSKYRIGVVVGAGADIPVNSEFTFGGEYTFSTYSSFSHDVSFPNGDNPFRVKVEPKTHSLMLNMRYKLLNSPF
ncbi:MAG: outer membrane beta-barrel protein [Pseudomonadota bacterium]